jgi:hypothetical protein
VRDRAPGALGLTLYGLAFGAIAVASVLLFYGALGASARMVWSSVALSGVAVALTVASVILGKR